MTPSILLALAALAGQPDPGWIWSYYDSGGAAVLAREVPDTDRLSAVLECEPGSGVAEITVYGPQARPGFVTVSAGTASADVERVEGDGLAVRLRLDHPVYLAFAGGRPLALRAGEDTASVPAPTGGPFQRFQAACAPA